MQPRNEAHPTDRRHELAADWLQRLDDPQLPQADLQAWLEWFESSDENRKAFEELQALRQRFRVLSSGARDELKRRTGVGAASTIVGAARWYRSSAVWAIAASMGAVVFCLAIWWNIQARTSETYASAENHHRTVVLDDGSSLVLGANAIVDVRYTPLRRFLNIQRGEAYFEVQRNRLRPFIVQAGDVHVTAVGTAFNVQRSTGKVTVTVTEGKVRVSSGQNTDGAGAGAELTPEAGRSEFELALGQQAVIPVTAVMEAAAAPAAVLPRPGWSGDQASFINAPLSDVLRVINRHAPTQLAIGDPRVADLTFSGTIFRSHVDEWVSSLPQVFPVRAVPLDNGVVMLISRERAQEP